MKLLFQIFTKPEWKAGIINYIICSMGMQHQEYHVIKVKKHH